MRTFRPALLLALLLAVPAAGQESPMMTKSEYFPLEKGYSWTYKSSAGMEITIRVKALEEFGEGKNKVPVAHLETSVDGRTVATERVTVKDDGVYRVAVADNPVEPPLLFLKLPPEKGKEWKVESSIASDKVKGTFKAGEAKVKVPERNNEEVETVTSTSADLTANGQKISITYHFAKGIGIVKQTANLGGVEVTLNLVKTTGLPKDMTMGQ
jgi:hypothetical protein